MLLPAWKKILNILAVLARISHKTFLAAIDWRTCDQITELSSLANAMSKPDVSKIGESWLMLFCKCFVIFAVNHLPNVIVSKHKYFNCESVFWKDISFKERLLKFDNCFTLDVTWWKPDSISVIGGIFSIVLYLLSCHRFIWRPPIKGMGSWYATRQNKKTPYEWRSKG